MDMKKTSLILMLLLLSSCWAVLPVHGYTWLNGWDFRKTLAISQSSDAGTNYQLNFTFHYGSGSDSGAVVYLDGHCQTDFDDLRFTEDDGTTFLDYWRKSYVEADQAEFWVEITANLTEAAAQIYVYYGNSEVDSASDQAATFINVIAGVVGAWMMNEALAADAVVDYSGNGNHGTPTDTTVVDGKYAGTKARSLDGIDDNVLLVPNSMLDFGVEARVFEFWFFRTIPPASTEKIVWFYESGIAQSAGVMLLSDGKLRYYPDGSSNVYSAILTSLSETWIHAVLVYDGSDGRWYINGEPSGGITTTTVRDFISCGVVFGAGYRDDTEVFDSHFSGKLSHIHMYNNLSADEISNLFNNFGDPSLEQGKVLVRKWVYPVPSVVAGSEEITVAPQGSLLASIVIGCLVLVPMFIAGVLILRRR